MKKRQLIITGIAILVVITGFGGMKLLESLKKQPAIKDPESVVRLVRVMEVQTDTLSKLTEVQGKLVAQERLEIFPEVTGSLLSTSKPFKVGQNFDKGEVLLAIDGSESQYNLQSQRSAFIALVAQLLPDIKIDHPDQFEIWSAFRSGLDPSHALSNLPSPIDPKLKSFLSSRGLLQQYYAIKALENRQSKFTIVAPFNGTITQGNANAGTVLRAGQKVGEFIKTGAFELEAAVPVQDAAFIKAGHKVTLTHPINGNLITGKIARVAGSADPTSQRVSLFIEVQHETLKEGIYLHGVIEAKGVSNAIALNRNLVGSDAKVFLVKDNVLMKKAVEIVDFYEGTVLVTGLQEGDLLLNQVIEGAYEGMPVKYQVNP